MDSFSGLDPVLTDSAQRVNDVWRPWSGSDVMTVTRQITHGQLLHAKYSKTPQVVHPVKLFWPKSRCFDYLYQDAAALLRLYPVQATICPYQDSSSDEDTDDEEEDAGKQQN